MSRYFSEKEFLNCTPSCSESQMSGEFMNVLDKVRSRAGIPLVLNCAYRSVEWDKSKGRSGTSSHCKGCAVDIRCNTSQNRFKIVAAAIAVGVTRIGIGKTFVHLDYDKDKVQQVIFHYYE